MYQIVLSTNFILVRSSQAAFEGQQMRMPLRLDGPQFVQQFKQWMYKGRCTGFKTAKHAITTKLTSRKMLLHINVSLGPPVWVYEVSG